MPRKPADIIFRGRFSKTGHVKHQNSDYWFSTMDLPWFYHGSMMDFPRIQSDFTMEKVPWLRWSPQTPGAALPRNGSSAARRWCSGSRRSRMGMERINDGWCSCFYIYVYMSKDLKGWYRHLYSRGSMLKNVTETMESDITTKSDNVISWWISKFPAFLQPFKIAVGWPNVLECHAASF